MQSKIIIHTFDTASISYFVLILVIIFLLIGEIIKCLIYMHKKTHNKYRKVFDEHLIKAISLGNEMWTRDVFAEKAAHIRYVSIYKTLKSHQRKHYFKIRKRIMNTYKDKYLKILTSVNYQYEE